MEDLYLFKKGSMKKLTVTLAISAYNEQENIIKFLKSVLLQKEENFIFKEILVFSDGSTDKTVELCKSLMESKIRVRRFRQRLGKSQRLNQIYQMVNTDFLIQSDADVVFSHPYVIRDVIKPLVDNNKVAMAGGNPKPLKGKTFTERAVNYTCEIYVEFRERVRGGNNIFSVNGRLLAYKKSLFKKLRIPNNMICNDVFTYYSALMMGYQYKFIKSAIVYFRSPQTLRDQIRQNSRFLASPIRMSKYFPKMLVKQETSIPVGLLTYSMLKQFIKHPLHCVYIFLVNRYCKLEAILLEKNFTARWDIAQSTKFLNS